MTDITDVDPADPLKQNSGILGPTGSEPTVQLSEFDKTCIWNDTEFEHGTQIRTEGKTYECNFGKWIPID
jgi:hypothetical protein